MNTQLLARLELYINNWLTETVDGDNSPDTYIHPKLVGQMAQAAALVYDSSVDGQHYAENESS